LFPLPDFSGNAFQIPLLCAKPAQQSVGLAACLSVDFPFSMNNRKRASSPHAFMRMYDLFLVCFYGAI
jgi:hypothetical protein